jgi:hypothetical protein
MNPGSVRRAQALGQARRHPQRHQAPDLQRERSFRTRLPAAAHVVRLRMDFARKEFPSAWSDALKAAVRGELLQLFERGRRPRA